MTQAVYRYVATRDDVAADVRTAHAQLELAIASLLSWRENVLPLLAANVTTALKAYEVGAYVRSERCRVSRQKSARSSCSLRSKA